MDNVNQLELIEKIIPTLNFKFPYDAQDYSEHLYYENYHSHSSLSNPRVVDSPTGMDKYVQRAKEFGLKNIYSQEHGFQGDFFANYALAEANGLNVIAGAEVYWVKDRHEKDRSNCHMIIEALNDEGRKELNYILSIANEDGFYGQPRVDIELVLSLTPENFVVTSACLAGWKYEDADQIWLQIAKHFGKHFFFEIQTHNTDAQKELNRHLLNLAEENGIDIICGLDSHYIDASVEDVMRNQIQQYKKSSNSDEDGWYLDYPDTPTIIKRLQEQGVLNDEQIMRSIMNSCIFASEENTPIVIDKSFKIPTLYPELTYEERCEIYKKLLSEGYKKEPVKSKERADGIRYEAAHVIESGVADYFITNHAIIREAVDNQGGVLTTTSRGSAASFYTNKLLGLTTVDRFDCDIPIYPERFLTKDRVIGAHSLPDIDFNITSQEPFVKASRKLLGEHACYPLMAIEVLKEKSAWQLYASNAGVEPAVANQISKYLDDYNKAMKHAEDDEKDAIHLEDYIPEPYYEIYMQSKDYQSIVMNIKVHACFPAGQIVLTDKGYKEIQDIQIGDHVLSHDNKYHQVLDTMERTSDNIWKIKTTGDDLLLTNNHPVYVRTNINAGGAYRQLGEPYWKKAEEITKDDWIGSPINTNSIIPTYSNTNKTYKSEYLDMSDPDFWWLVGRYMGDGWTESPKYYDGKSGTRHRVVICCNKNNNEILDIMTRIPKYLHFNITEARTSFKMTTENKVLFDFLQQFGKYAYGKHLTNTILDLPKNLLQVFLEGYWSADGNLNLNSERRKFDFTTVSRELAYGLQQCIHKAYNVPCTITISKPGTDIIEGRIINRRKKYRGHFILDKDVPNRVNKFIDGMMWFKVRDICQVEGEKKVYNLSVNEANSYTVNNLAVHNCGHLVFNGDVRREIGLTSAVSESTGNRTLVACIQGGYLDMFGYVKNDYLLVSSVGLTNELYKSIGMKVPTFNELRKMVTDDEPTWRVYAEGITVAVNQCEQTATVPKVMKFKPHSMSELSQFIAAIRPGFASLLKVFLNREEYSVGEANVDELLADTSHFLLYQESIMKILGFLGLEMGETYNVIKSISKKKLKGEKKAHLLEELREGWMKKFGNLDNFDRVWQVISDSAAYGFNAPHAYSMAGDSAYAAWFKGHYPGKFYEVAIQFYQQKEDKDKINALLKEALKFYGFRLGEYTFGDDNRKVTVNEITKIITPNLSSIKGFGEQVVENLYELGKCPEDTFLEEIPVILANKINHTQLEGLVRINYFSRYGTVPKLLKTLEYYDILKGGSAKSMSKDKVAESGIPIELFKKYGNETAKQYNKLDSMSILKELIEEIPARKETLSEKLVNELMVMGVCRTVDPEANKHWYVVSEIEKKKSIVNISLYEVYTGEVRKVKMWMRQFFDERQDSDVCQLGDILYLTKDSYDKKNQTERTDQINPKNGKPIYVPIPDKYEFWLKTVRKVNMCA